MSLFHARQGMAVLVLWLGLLSLLPAEELDFAGLLDEAGLVFVPPAGYQDVTPASNEVIHYERALRSPDGLLEIRYVVRPLQRMKIDYDDPHGAVPEPNHIFPLMFQSLTSSLSAGGHAPSREYSAEEANKRFRADWAAASVFDVAAGFGTNHGQGLLLALHRNKVSDAYVIFLFDDYARVKVAIDAAMESLVYRSAVEVAGK